MSGARSSNRGYVEFVPSPQSRAVPEGKSLEQRCSAIQQTARKVGAKIISPMRETVVHGKQVTRVHKVAGQDPRCRSEAVRPVTPGPGGIGYPQFPNKRFGYGAPDTEIEASGS
jgi:hypothetical protein